MSKYEGRPKEVDADVYVDEKEVYITFGFTPVSAVFASFEVVIPMDKLAKALLPHILKEIKQ